MLQPDHYTALLLQASANRDSNERLPLIPASTDSGTERYSRETSLDAPVSTPFSHESICLDVSPAILASTLHKNLGMTEATKYRDIPATTTAPNSPAAIQEGGFGSLMCVSMAIMQGRT